MGLSGPGPIRQINDGITTNAQEDRIHDPTRLEQQYSARNERYLLDTLVRQEGKEGVRDSVRHKLPGTSDVRRTGNSRNSLGGDRIRFS